MAQAVIKLEHLSAPSLHSIQQEIQANSDYTDLFSLFGWSDLPIPLKMLIASDLSAYRDELIGLFSTRDSGVLRRRASVCYWVNMFRDGHCSLNTAITALSPSC